MSPANNYKDAEEKFVKNMSGVWSRFFAAFVAFIKNVIRKGKQRFTVMFIPHSEKKILNFHISVFALVFFICLGVVVVLGFVVVSTLVTSSQYKVTTLSGSLEESKSFIEAYEDEIKEIAKDFAPVKKGMDEIVKLIDPEASNSYFQEGVGGDFNSSTIINAEEYAKGRELSELRDIRAYLRSMSDPLNKVHDIISQQKELLVDIPHLWPVLSVNGRKIGRITEFFGPTSNPITNQFRLHRGLDIAWAAGTPIVATARGVVVGVDNEPFGLGWNVTVKHKYGFMTRYGHFQRITVSKGDVVERGDIIGLMGSTGMSTGPHLHYEVWMGNQVVDPIQYLEIQQNLIEKYK
ncbi:MAG: M23 family metallopeptidase [Spirochaetales bacterium]|nr:M23 family metallopeptidase [Spirochaetales bacterium]